VSVFSFFPIVDVPRARVDDMQRSSEDEKPAHTRRKKGVYKL
jgi:hypothetical protein